MSAIILQVMPEVEVDFQAWEKSFHAHPCQATLEGVFPCGHEAKYRATARCRGCGRGRENVYFCADHLAAYHNNLIAFHIAPCGLAGYVALLSSIEAVE